MARRRCPASPAEYPTGLQLFLDFNNCLGALQSSPEPRILPLGPRQFRRQRVRRRGLGSPLGGRQRIQSSAVALPAPGIQHRGVQAFPAQDCPDPTSADGAVCLRQNAQLLLLRKRSTPCPLRQFGRRCRRCRHCGRPTAFLRSGAGGTVCLGLFMPHNHDDCPSPPRLNFRAADVSSSLARRALNVIASAATQSSDAHAQWIASAFAFALRRDLR